MTTIRRLWNTTGTFAWPCWFVGQDMLTLNVSMTPASGALTTGPPPEVGR